jgi:hypothetical protein
MWLVSGAASVYLVLLNEVLQMVCSLLSHRRSGELLVELGGVQLLLSCPR